MERQEIYLRRGAVSEGYWQELWHYRELLYFLAWRDILVRYKQTVAGVGWAVLRPIITVVVFTVLFGRLGKLPSGGVPYPVLVLAAMPAWQMFSTALASASQSVIANTSLISKVYFPRLIVPCGAAGATLADFFITLLLCAAGIWCYGVAPSWNWLCIVPFSLFAFIASLGPTILLSALSVQYRDFKHIIPFMVQIGAYVTPVGFSSAIVPEKWRWLYACNPMVGVVDGFRWSFYGMPLDLFTTAVSMVSGTCLLGLGLLCFRKMERGFADVI